MGTVRGLSVMESLGGQSDSCPRLRLLWKTRRDVQAELQGSEILKPVVRGRRDLGAHCIFSFVVCSMGPC